MAGFMGAEFYGSRTAHKINAYRCGSLETAFVV